MNALAMFSLGFQGRERKLSRAHFLTKTDSKSAGFICQVYDARSGRLWTTRRGELDSRLQRTIGNQAVLRMLQTNAEELKAGLTGTHHLGLRTILAEFPYILLQ